MTLHLFSLDLLSYRIPYSAVHPTTLNTFSLEFSDYLDSLLLSKASLCISGDFNFHIDVSGDVDSAKFVDLLESMCLTQHVRSSTHIQGHIFDLVITRNFDNMFKGRPIADRFISDHCSVLCRPSPIVKKNQPPKTKDFGSDSIQR